MYDPNKIYERSTNEANNTSFLPQLHCISVNYNNTCIYVYVAVSSSMSHSPLGIFAVQSSHRLLFILEWSIICWIQFRGNFNNLYMKKLQVSNWFKSLWKIVSKNKFPLMSGFYLYQPDHILRLLRSTFQQLHSLFCKDKRCIQFLRAILIFFS